MSHKFLPASNHKSEATPRPAPRNKLYIRSYDDRNEGRPVTSATSIVHDKPSPQGMTSYSVRKPLLTPTQGKIRDGGRTMNVQQRTSPVLGTAAPNASTVPVEWSKLESDLTAIEQLSNRALEAEEGKLMMRQFCVDELAS